VFQRLYLWNLYSVSETSSIYLWNLYSAASR